MSNNFGGTGIGGFSQPKAPTNNFGSFGNNNAPKTVSNNFGGTGIGGFSQPKAPTNNFGSFGNKGKLAAGGKNI